MSGASTRASPRRATGSNGGNPAAWSPAQWVIGGRGPRGVVTGPVGDWWADHLRNVISTCGGRTCGIPGCDGPPTNHPLGLRSSLRTPLSVHGPLAKPGQRVWDPALAGSPAATVRPLITQWASALLRTPLSAGWGCLAEEDVLCRREGDGHVLCARLQIGVQVGHAIRVAAHHLLAEGAVNLLR